METKYLVVAVKWIDSEKKQGQEIIGAFKEYYLAAMFRDAYNKYFNANSKVVEIKAENL